MRQQSDVSDDHAFGPTILIRQEPLVQVIERFLPAPKRGLESVADERDEKPVQVRV